MEPSPSSVKSISKHRRSPRWKGTRMNGMYYGPSSLVYFTHRLSTFTKMDFESNFLSAPKFSASSSRTGTSNQLQREQQDALLDLYWQGYHAIYPVLDEADFRRHYETLWHNSSGRKPCPLVDIVMALCIHFGSSYTASDPVALPDQPGYGFYTQSQQLIYHDLEISSLKTVQCYFLSAIYLLALGQVNSASMMVGSAIRAAESLGLQFGHDHDEMPNDEPRSSTPDSRIWTCLITLDTQLSLYLGRPFGIQDSHVHSMSQPESDQVAQLTGPTFTLADVNWLHFQYERQRLFNMVREIQTELMVVSEDVLEEINSPDFYQHPSSREKCAQYLSQQLKRLKTWVEDLPEALKTLRVQGVPFSVDRSALNLSQTEPLWLQRQRLILELDYHALIMMLTRTFNSFLPTPALGTFSSDNHCMTSVNSAIMVTNMLNQVLNDSEILTGWYQVIDWQRTATFALAGFACGYPICPLSPSARKALTRAAGVFERAGSRDMVQLAQTLKTKCLDIVQAFCARLGIVTPANTPADQQTSPETVDESSVPSTYNVMSIGEEALANIGLDNISDDPLWAGETPSALLWGDLMRDLDSGLASSLGHIGVTETSNQT
ncbi:hypothetical protein CEP53_008152 [Fusarium sp. AF-6]|nr:hypothetical protein CEP53_008152 [Fusarium sp. AF-6]